MGILTGLSAFKSDLDDSGSGGKIKYLKLTPGQTVKMWFLDDLDSGTSATDAGAGVAVMIKEHQAGQNYRIKAQCTNPQRDGSPCYGCEQAIAHPKKGWGVKKRVYANVVVDDGKNDPYVAVWNIATKNNAAWEVIMEEFFDSGSISMAPWRVRRAGEGTDTTYIVKQVPGEPLAFEDFEGFDLSEIVLDIPYEAQAEHYNKVWESNTPSQPVEAATDEW